VGGMLSQSSPTLDAESESSHLDEVLRFRVKGKGLRVDAGSESSHLVQGLGLRIQG